MVKHLQKLLFTLSIILAFTGAFAQNEKPKKPATMPGGIGDTSKPKMSKPKKEGVTDYKELITDKTKTKQGLFIIHEVDDKYYLEIPKNLLGRQILINSRVSKGSKLKVPFAGTLINEDLIHLWKGEGDKLLGNRTSLIKISSDSSENSMSRNLAKNNITPIDFIYEIKSYNIKAKDTIGYLIDFTAQIRGTDPLLIGPSTGGFSGIDAELSTIDTIKSLRNKLEIVSTKVASGYRPNSKESKATASKGTNTPSPANPAMPKLKIELTYSMIVLPQSSMKTRIYDGRIGYKTTEEITDYDSNPNGIEIIQYIQRYRLEPKPEDIENYKKGELVSPKKPIIFYIDSTTPKKWIPYFIAGVNAWQPAFEKAGFKNAILAKIEPSAKEDETFNIQDADCNAIVYTPDNTDKIEISKSVDPRTGEILQTHVTWNNGVIADLENKYFVAAAPLDPRAQKYSIDPETLGSLMQSEITKTIGDAIGLAPNLAASSTIPVEKLRDNAWIEKNGISGSIMDENPYNYVAQPEDKINVKNLLPTIGAYDKWAIEWGYRAFPNAKSEKEELTLIENLTKANIDNPLYLFGTNNGDAFNQLNDLSNNLIVANSNGIKNLTRIMQNIIPWTTKPSSDYNNFSKKYQSIVDKYLDYTNKIVSLLGNIHTIKKYRYQQGSAYEYASKATQQNAVKWINDNVFNEPKWLLNEEVYGKTGGSPNMVINTIQTTTLNSIANKLENLITLEAINTKQPNYTVYEIFNDLSGNIFSELNSKKPISSYRIALQQNYITLLSNIISASSATKAKDASMPIATTTQSRQPITSSDVFALARYQLKSLLRKIKASSMVYTDRNAKIHLLDLQDRISKTLDPK